jgi:predicted nucleic acid-binding Zn ribbon protein
MENLARYIIRASFSQERLTYIREESKVIYQSKARPRHQSGNGKQQKEFDVLEWLAAMCSHIPNRGEQMVKYYGFYSNRSRGDRKKQTRTRSAGACAACDPIPYIIEPVDTSPAKNKNWARLIQKIYEVNPLECPKCHGSMRIIAIIEQEQTVKKILKHVGLWEVRSRPPPKIHSPPGLSAIDYVDIQYRDENYCDPDYPFEAYLN